MLTVDYLSFLKYEAQTALCHYPWEKVIAERESIVILAIHLHRLFGLHSTEVHGIGIQKKRGTVCCLFHELRPSHCLE